MPVNNKKKDYFSSNFEDLWLGVLFEMNNAMNSFS